MMFFPRLANEEAGVGSIGNVIDVFLSSDFPVAIISNSSLLATLLWIMSQCGPITRPTIYLFLPKVFSTSIDPTALERPVHENPFSVQFPAAGNQMPLEHRD